MGLEKYHMKLPWQMLLNLAFPYCKDPGRVTVITTASGIEFTNTNGKRYYNRATFQHEEQAGEEQFYLCSDESLNLFRIKP